MTSTLRALFLARPAREKFLLLILLLVGAVIWCVSLVGRAEAFATQARGTSSQLKNQALWISRQASIEKQAEQEAGQLEPSKTLDALRLTGEVQNLAKDAGLQFNISPGQETSYANFAFHSVTVSMQRASWEALVKFYLAVQQRAPYIGIDSFSILADRANPALLNAYMSIASVEIVHAP